MGGERFLRPLTRFGYALLAIGAAVLAWKLAVVVFAPAPFLLPPPERVAATAWNRAGYLLGHAGTTLAEMLLGLAFGSVAGVTVALAMAQSKFVARVMLPFVVTTQTLPVFAIAPLIVIWFGYGMPSKVVMASLIIFFPVASAFLDGLTNVRREWLDLAAGWGAGRYVRLLKIQAPAALPSLATGLKLAASLAPIGAVVGEWAGASAGLGYVMLQANARSQTDLVFACLVLLALMALALRAAMAAVVDRLVFWQSHIE